MNEFRIRAMIYLAAFSVSPALANIHPYSHLQPGDGSCQVRRVRADGSIIWTPLHLRTPRFGTPLAHQKPE